MNEKNSRNVNLIGAITSGLCVGFILAWSRSSGDESYVLQLIRIALLAVSSYSVVAFLLFKWNSPATRILPNWLLIAVLGSFVCFLSIDLIPDMKYIWKFRDSAVVGYAYGLIKEEIVRLIINVITNSLIALPIMMITRYFDRGFNTGSPRSTDDNCL